MNKLLDFAEKKERLALWWALALAFILRAAYGAAAARVAPWSDMLDWDKARQAIAYGLPYSASWTPAYPAALALVTKVFGESYAAFYAANAAFSAATCALIFFIAKETFGRKTAWLALLFSVFYVDMIWYSGVMLAETMGMLLLAFTAWLVVKDRHPALAGLAFGLTCMVKGLFLLALPAFLLWIWYKYRSQGWFKKAVYFSLLAGLAMLPWNLRNMRVHKEPVLLEPHWALAIFDGHNPYSTGGCDYLFLGTDYGKFYTDPNLSMVEKGRICKQKSLEFALNNPLREVQLTLLKASKHLVFTTSFVLYRTDYPLRKTFFTLSTLQNTVLFPLCVIGLVFAFRDRNAFGLSLIILFFVGVFITLFAAEVRKRMPFVPFLLLLAAHGAMLLPGLLQRVRAHDTADIHGKLLTAGAACALLYANFFYRIAIRWQDVLGRFN